MFVLTITNDFLFEISFIPIFSETQKTQDAKQGSVFAEK